MPRPTPPAPRSARRGTEVSGHKNSNRRGQVGSPEAKMPQGTEGLPWQLVGAGEVPQPSAPPVHDPLKFVNQGGLPDVGLPPRLREFEEARPVDLGELR